MNRLIAVLGGLECDEATAALAFEVGSLIAKQKDILICGGYGGVMEAACKGAKNEGDTTIGILSGKDASKANSFIDTSIVTGLGEAANSIILRSAAGAIALPGSFSTLTEIGCALKFHIPVISIKSWKRSSELTPHHTLKAVQSAQEAIAYLEDKLSLVKNQ